MNLFHEAMFKCYFIFIICALSHLPLPWQQRLVAQISPFITEQWQGFNEGYSPTALAVIQQTAFIDEVTGLSIIDVSAPDSPRIHSTLSLPLGRPRALRIANDTLLLAVSDSGLTILDISTPTEPQILFDTSLRNISGVDMKGLQLYLTVNYSTPANYGRAYVYDVSDWNAVRHILTIPHFFTISDVRVVGNLLFVATHYTDNIGYEIFRINSSGTPDFLKRWFPPEWFVADLAFRDSILILMYDRIGIFTQKDIQTFHVSDSADITPLTEYRLPVEGVTFTLVDSSLIIQSFPYLISGSLHLDGSITFTDTILTRPNRSVSTTRNGIRSSDSSIAYLSAEGLWTMALDSNGLITTQGFLKTREFSLGVDGAENIAYAVTTDRLRILDFRNPLTPDTLVSFPLIAEYVEAIDKDRIIVYDSILTLLDITDRQAPKILHRIGLGKNAYGANLAIQDSLIAVACAERGLFILGMRGDSLKMINQLPFRGVDVLWKGDTLLSTGLDTMLSIWDMSDPASPSFITSIPPPNRNAFGYTLDMAGDSLIIGGSLSTLLFNAPSLHALSPLDTFRPSLRARLWHGILLGCEYMSGLYAYDIRSGQIRIGGTSIDRDASFYIGRSLLYASAGAQGLKVLRIDTATLSAPSGPGRPGQRTPAITIRPNPFSSISIITYDLQDRAQTTLGITDMLGRPIWTLVDDIQGPGYHSILVDRAGLPDGIYYYHLIHGTQRSTGKIFIVK